NNDFYLSESPIFAGTHLIIKSNDSGTQLDTIFEFDVTLFDVYQLPDAPFVDAENEKLYYFFLKDDGFSDEVTRVFRRSNLDGSNLEILDSTLYLNTSNADEIEAWTIDPSVGG